MDEEEDRLYVPYAEGELGEDAERVSPEIGNEP
jgi:hypothetical protein